MSESYEWISSESESIDKRVSTKVEVTKGDDNDGERIQGDRRMIELRNSYNAMALHCSNKRLSILVRCHRQ
jgi:hypothetical protein